MNEQIFLSQLMKNINIIYDTVLTESYFKAKNEKLLFNALKKCCDYNLEPIYTNIQDVEPELKADYLVNINNAYPSSINWKHFEEKIINEHKAHNLQSLSAEINNRIKGENEPDEIIDYIESCLIKITEQTDNNKIFNNKQLVGEFLELVEERVKMKGELLGVPSPWNNLNRHTLGFQNRLFYVIGARPSQGKTAVILNMINHFVKNKVTVGFISAESSRREMISRMIASEMPINMQKLKTGMMSKTELDNMQFTMDKFRNDYLYITDITNIRLSELRIIAKRMKIKNNIKILCIDYLTKIKNDNQTLPMNVQVAEISTALKCLSIELDIPIICTAQINRAGDSKPQMKDLLWSGQIEQDADFIMLIHNDGDNTEFIIDKHRDGPLGVVEMIFKRDCLKFYEREVKRMDKGE